MSDNILSAVLTFSLLAAGTAAVGSEMFARPHQAAAMAQVTLPPVTVVGHRETATATVTLPLVTVIGRRQPATALAAASATVDTTHLE